MRLCYNVSNERDKGDTNMGATNFLMFANAKNAKSGFRQLSEDAIYEYGNDAYNGTISTTSFVGVTKTVADKYTKTAEKTAVKYIENHDFGRKWECRAVDCGVVEYRIITVKKDTSFKSKGAPKYETRFVVVTDWNGRQALDQTFANQTEAVKAWGEAVRRGKVPADAYVTIVKKPVLVSGQAEVARVVPVVKTYKSRPKNIPAGAVVEEIHRYAYYGWASC